MLDNRFYVYLHRRLDNGKVFYVGKGTGNRAWLKDSRKSMDWKAVVNEAGYYVEIYRSNLTEEQAFSLESYLILNPKNRWELVNHTLSTAVKFLDYKYLSKIVEYDETSPSCLVWKQPIYRSAVGGCVGSLKQHKNGKPHKWTVCINRKLYAVHRIVYLLKYPEFDQSKLINHIDCNPCNNKISNLELVTKKENNNRTALHTKGQLRSNNTSKYTNINIVKGKYSISIVVSDFLSGRKKSKSFVANFVNFDYILEQAISYRDAKQLNKE